MVGAVNGISGAISGLATGGDTSGVGFDTFLKLLVTQLQNQDPLNPMEGTEFTSQIAQFSQLEQTIQGNSYLEKLTQSRDYGLQALAVGTIGRDVLLPGSGGLMVNGEMEFGYKLADRAARVNIEIVNSGGQTVRTLNGDVGAGAHTLTWDGTDEDGNLLPDGAYNLRISASDIEGAKLPVDIFTYGVVTEVTNDGEGNVSVGTADGRTAKFEDVLSIRAFQG
ncbi:MAG: hypothetical protein H6922_02685 [Pseudomonadaceae bacterium]|nr:hypothetical protein [Pseudomonadaceae bacterium]